MRSSGLVRGLHTIVPWRVVRTPVRYNVQHGRAVYLEPPPPPASRRATVERFGCCAGSKPSPSTWASRWPWRMSRTNLSRRPPRRGSNSPSGAPARRCHATVSCCSARTWRPASKRCGSGGCCRRPACCGDLGQGRQRPETSVDGSSVLQIIPKSSRRDQQRLAGPPGSAKLAGTPGSAKLAGWCPRCAPSALHSIVSCIRAVLTGAIREYHGCARWCASGAVPRPLVE